MSTTISSTLFHGSRALEAASSTGGQPVGPPQVAPPKVAAAASASHGGGPETQLMHRQRQPETLRRPGRDEPQRPAETKDRDAAETKRPAARTAVERGEVPLLLSSAPSDPEARLEVLEDVREQVEAEQPPSAQRRWVSTTAMVQTTSTRVEMHLSRARDAYAEPPPPPGDSVDAKV